MRQPPVSPRMFRATGIGLIFGLATMTSMALAGDLLNSQWGFQTSYPDTWTVEQFTPGPLIVQGVPAGETLVNCNTTAASIAETKNMTQADINNQVNPEQLNETFWRTAIYTRVQNVKIESHGVRLHPSGIKVPEAFVSYDQTEQGVTIHARARSTIFITPGATFSITCNAIAEKYDTYSAAFAGVVDSFRMKNAIVASLSANQSYAPQRLPINLNLATYNAMIGVNTRRARMH